MKNRRRFLLSFAALPALPLAALAQNIRTKSRDPVCGLWVEKDPSLMSVWKGITYYFCSKADRDQFTKQPEKYIAAKLIGQSLQ
jgi:YHS domain-containing protein